MGAAGMNAGSQGAGPLHSLLGARGPPLCRVCVWVLTPVAGAAASLLMAAAWSQRWPSPGSLQVWRFSIMSSLYSHPEVWQKKKLNQFFLIMSILYALHYRNPLNNTL